MYFIFYCLDSNGLDKIKNELNANNYYDNYINKLEIPLELISFSSNVYSSSIGGEIEEEKRQKR